MDRQNLEATLKTIRDLDRERETLVFRINELREWLLDTLKEEKIKQFKTSIATVSYTLRTTLKYDKDEILEKLKDNYRFVDIIPEHKELNKTFENSIKNGTLKMDDVEIITKETPMIRFY